jgi:hypothetical protein
MINRTQDTVKLPGLNRVIPSGHCLCGFFRRPEGYRLKKT